MPVHTEHIRSLVSPENLLEFHSRDGCEPLCRFLGKDVLVGVDFLYLNKGDGIANYAKMEMTFKKSKIFALHLLAMGGVWTAWRWIR